MNLPLLLGVVVLGSALGTGVLRWYAIAHSVLDVPNARSSHVTPTPRGGGVAIVVAFLAAVALLAATRVIDERTFRAIAGAGATIAVVGFIDDHRPLAARWRLLAHFAAASWAIVTLGGLPPIALVHGRLDLGLVGDVLAAIALVWLLNLYNFMDGIDGIAGVEAVTCCLGAMLLASTQPATRSEWVVPAVLAAAVLGFLAWNFPPAKIFMGDAGSGFLGLILGILAIRAAHISPVWLWSWLILLGVFVVDATLTLFRRIARREKVYQAHRSHAYQHAAIRAGSHWPVTVVVAAINLLWLLPIALAVGVGWLPGVAGLALAYAPLIAVAHRFGAGAATPPSPR